MKKKMDEQITKISSENCMFQNLILELKQANVKLQNEIDELEKYGWPAVSNELMTYQQYPTKAVKMFLITLLIYL